MSGLTWVSGRFITPGEPCLEAGERGFLFGDGLFETVRLYGGQAPAWARHAARLAEGCRTLGIPYPGEEIAAGLAAVLDALAGSTPASGHQAGAGGESGAGGAGSLRLTVTRGAHPPGVRGLLPHWELRPTVVLTANPGEPYPPAAYRSGQRGVTVSFPRNQRSPLVRLKSLNCLENVLGRREAVAAGADEGLFFNFRGELAEGTASNIFLLFAGGRLVTPPAGSGLLPGIAREIVLAAGGGLGLAVSEEATRRRDFESAREVWLTNSLLEVMPLVSLDGVPVGNGGPGEIAFRMRQAYRDYVQRHLRQEPGPE